MKDGCPYCEVAVAVEPDPWERIRALQDMASDKWPTMPFVGGLRAGFYGPSIADRGDDSD